MPRESERILQTTEQGFFFSFMKQYELNADIRVEVMVTHAGCWLLAASLSMRYTEDL